MVLDKMNKKRIMTPERELAIWRSWLYSFYNARHITFDQPTIQHLFYYMDKWGRANSQGNGSLNTEKLVRDVLLQMEDAPWRDSNWNSRINTRFKKEYEKEIKHWRRGQKKLEAKRKKRLEKLVIFLKN